MENQTVGKEEVVGEGRGVATTHIHSHSIFHKLTGDLLLDDAVKGAALVPGWLHVELRGGELPRAQLPKVLARLRTLSWEKIGSDNRTASEIRRTVFSNERRSEKELHRKREVGCYTFTQRGRRPLCPFDAEQTHVLNK